VRRFGVLCPISLRRRIRLAINLLQPMPATIQQLRRAVPCMLSNLQCMHSTVWRRMRADEVLHRLIQINTLQQPQGKPVATQRAQRRIQKPQIFFVLPNFLSALWLSCPSLRSLWLIRVSNPCDQLPRRMLPASRMILLAFNSPDIGPAGGSGIDEVASWREPQEIAEVDCAVGVPRDGGGEADEIGRAH